MKRLLTLLLGLLITQLSGQTTYIPRGHHQGYLIQRYELLSGSYFRPLHSDVTPFSRKAIHEFLLANDSAELFTSRADQFNLRYLTVDNLPYTVPEDAASRKPVLKYFYRDKVNLFSVNEDQFSLYINPLIDVQGGMYNGDFIYRNTRGVSVRGMINKRVGFYSEITENQFIPTAQEKDYYEKYGALPGAHLVKRFKNDGMDYLNASGYFTFRLIPAIELQVGQDRNFVGMGLRSLLLTDFTTSYPFIKINTNISAFNYQNLYAKLTDKYGTDGPWPVKYLVGHTLSVNVFRNLKIGFYESVVFHDNKRDGRGIDLSYLNPIILYRSVEHLVGDPDKMLVGFNAGYIPFKGVNIYGQFMLNEFRMADLKSGNGHVHNKFGYQVGGQYVDAFGIKNLDLQAEYNRVRPYSYTHGLRGEDTRPVNSYTHYGQHLAHPLGANFSEVTGAVSFQPWPKLWVKAQAIYGSFGTDTLDSNWGQNVFLDYNTYERLTGNMVGQGVPNKLLNADLAVSYHLKHNLFLDITGKGRIHSVDGIKRNSNFIGLGVRLNMPYQNWHY